MLVRQSVPPDDYITHIMQAKFCPVCGGFSQWTPRLAEALYYECVPIILSPMMLPPWSRALDWSKFSVRMEPTKAQERDAKQESADEQAVKVLMWNGRGAY